MPYDADFLKARIDASRENIGRYVYFYTPSSDAEFTASGFYNPLTYTGFRTALTETRVLARIHWASDERITATPGGKYYVGDCTLGIDPKYKDLATECMNSDEGRVLVDDKYMTVTAIDPLGAPSINRLHVICKAVGDK